MRSMVVRQSAATSAVRQEQADEEGLNDSQDGAATSHTSRADATSASQQLCVTAAEAKELLRGSFAFNRVGEPEAHSASPSRLHAGGTVSHDTSMSATPPYVASAPRAVKTPPPSIHVSSPGEAAEDDDLSACAYTPTFLPPTGSHLPALPAVDAKRFEILADSSSVFNWQLTGAGRAQAYKDLFAMYDVDANGTLDAMEMCELLEALGFDTGSNVGQKELLKSSTDQATSDAVEDVHLFSSHEHPVWFRRFVSRHTEHHAGSRGASRADSELTFTFDACMAAIRELDPASNGGSSAAVRAAATLLSVRPLQTVARENNRRRLARCQAETTLHKYLKAASYLNVERRMAVKHEVTRMRKYSDWFKASTSGGTAGEGGVYFDLRVQVPPRLRRLLGMLEKVDADAHANLVEATHLQSEKGGELSFSVIVGDSSTVHQHKLRMKDTLAALKFRAEMKIKPVLHLLRDSCEYVRSVDTRVFPKFYKSPTRRLSLATRLSVDQSQNFDWDVTRDERGLQRLIIVASGVDGVEKGDQIRTVVVGDSSSPFGEALHTSIAGMTAALRTKLRPLVVTFSTRRSRVRRNDETRVSEKTTNEWQRVLRSVPDVTSPQYDFWEHYDVLRPALVCSITQACGGDIRTLQSESYSFERLHLTSKTRAGDAWHQKFSRRASSVRASTSDNSYTRSVSFRLGNAAIQLPELDVRALPSDADERSEGKVIHPLERSVPDDGGGDGPVEVIELCVQSRTSHWCAKACCGAGLAYRLRRQRARIRESEEKSATVIQRQFKHHVKMRNTLVDQFVVEGTGADIARIQSHFATWLLYIVFLAVYIAMVTQQRGNGSIYVVEKGIHNFIKGTFIEKEHMDEKYDAVANSEDFWKWIKVFVAENYDASGYQNADVHQRCSGPDATNDLCAERRGFMGTYNRLYGPAVVVVRRRKMEECSSDRGKNLTENYGHCYRKVQKWSPMDLAGSSTTPIDRDYALFGGNADEDITDYTGTEGLLHTWDAHWKGYPLYLNLGSSPNSSSTMDSELAKLDLWELDHFIDKSVWHIEFVFLTYNANKARELMTAARVMWDISTGGTYNDMPYEKVRVSSVDVNVSVPLDTFTDFFKTRNILVFTVVIFVVFQIYEEISDIMEEGLANYATDGWNIMDFLGIMSIVAQMILSAHIGTTSKGVISVLPSNPWVLDVNGQFTEFANAYAELGRVDGLVRFWEALVPFTLLLQIIRMFKYLEWHPRLNLISATMREAAPEFMAWTIVFVIVLVLSGFLGHHLFGRYLVGFYSWENSVITVFRVIFGDFNYDDLVENRYHFGLIFFLLIQLLLTVLLMNVMLAIVIGAFVEIQPGTKKAGTLQEDTEYICVQFSKSCLNIATCVHCCTNHTHTVSRHQLVRHVRCDQMLRMSGLSKIFFVCRRQDRACAKKWRRRKSKLFAKGFLCKPACGGTPYLLRHQAFQRLQYLMRNSRGTHEGIPAASLSLVLSRVTDNADRKYLIARLIKKAARRNEQKVTRFLEANRLRKYRHAIGKLTAADKDQMRVKQAGVFPEGVAKVLEDIQDKITLVTRESAESANTMKNAVKRMMANRRGAANESGNSLKDVVASLMRQKRASADLSTPITLTSTSAVASVTSDGEASGTALTGEGDILSLKVERLESKMDGIIAALAVQSELLRSFTSNVARDEDSY